MHATLLRLLFPSWAFFDRITDSPSLQLRTVASDGEPGEWLTPLSAPRRSVGQLLYNPEGAAHLLLQGAVDRFAVAREEQEDDRIGLEIVAGIARRALAPALTVAGLERWQWRVVAIDSEPPHVVRVLYCSAWQDRDAVTDGRL